MKTTLACFDNHQHSIRYLEVISIIHNDVVSEQVIRWCKCCGAITIDTDYDGRTNAGDIRPMEFPRYVIEIR
jgi:hypothetical protein